MSLNENDLRARVVSQFDRTLLPTFTETTFLGHLTGFKGNQKTGDLDLTLSVGPGEKHAALPVTDVYGELLLIHVRRVPMRSIKERNAAQAEATIQDAGEAKTGRGGKASRAAASGGAGTASGRRRPARASRIRSAKPR